MKIVHIESGLGNQMLSFCEYLAIKKMNPNDNCYIETIVYDIPECNESICQWNGYELERVFGIKAPNIKDIIPSISWDRIIKQIKQSSFWEKDWNYPKYFTEAFDANGLHLLNLRGDFESKEYDKEKSRGAIGKIRQRFFNQSRLGVNIKRIVYRLFSEKYIASINNQSNIFLSSSDNIFTGQWLTFRYKSNGIERIKEDIEKTFIFPEFSDKKNSVFAEFLSSHNSVFIHARRGDMLSANGWCYKYGYFKRAVSYIKKHIDSPVFVFFTNPGSVEWCKENPNIFGLNYSHDKVFFVDWNSGEESFRDMQLMSYCKHAIITDSSFGWWGAYFINNPNKITISPSVLLNTTKSL